MRIKKLHFILFILLIGLSACGNDAIQPSGLEPDSDGSEIIESSAQEEPEAKSQVELAEVDDYTDKPFTAPPVSDYILSIVESGYFSDNNTSGEHGFKTYTNTALKFIYNKNDDDTLFFGINTPLTLDRNYRISGGLMSYLGFKEVFNMYVIDGSGEEWVRKQADLILDLYIQIYREEEEWLRENFDNVKARYGASEFETYDEYAAHSINSRAEREENYKEWYKEWYGEEYEKQIYAMSRGEYEHMDFWLAEYEAAGMSFTGLQVNFISPGSGFNHGFTFLHSQIDDDVAIVISVETEEGAGSAAKRHMGRFSIYEEQPKNIIYPYDSGMNDMSKYPLKDYELPLGLLSTSMVDGAIFGVIELATISLYANDLYFWNGRLTPAQDASVLCVGKSKLRKTGNVFAEFL